MGLKPSDAKPGDFILVHIPGNGGVVIRALQGLNGDGFSDYEHVALYCGGTRLIEMHSGGVQSGDINKYMTTPTIWSTGTFVITDIERANIVKSANDYLNAKIGYSWADYAALALHHFHSHNDNLKNAISSSKSMICSQFVDRCYSDAGVHLFMDNRWPGYVTPGDLYQLLKGHQDNEA